ncbi:MAG: methyltransferase family protein [Betaproteobacteria bacterium]
MRRALLVVVISLSATAAFVIIGRGTTRQCHAIGVALALVGLPLMVLSRAHLGSAFSVAPKAATLVTHGLYSKIPHPLYVFLDLVLLGIVIALRWQWLVAVWLALIIVQAWQAAREARALEQTFGDVYRTYRAQTWW